MARAHWNEIMGVSTKRIGNASEARVLSMLVLRGWPVCLPFGDTEPYDMIVDRCAGAGFEKVQVKTGTLENGAVTFSATSTVTKREGAIQRQNYQGLVDLFGVYCPELDEVYLIPIRDMAETRCTLRIDPPKNGQIKGIRLAAHYVVKM